MFIIASGNSEMISRAKKTILATLISLFIIYAAWLILAIFFKAIQVYEWVGVTEGGFRLACRVPGKGLGEGICQDLNNNCICDDSEPPTVTKVNPNSGYPCETKSIQIEGTNFSPAPIITISFGKKIDVTNFKVISPTTISCEIYIRPEALKGSRTVTVTNVNGDGICPKCFEVKEVEVDMGKIMDEIINKIGYDFKELYEIAKWAGQAAGGVRPALILGLLQTESALGTDIGQCNCAGQAHCPHPEIGYKQVMKRDQWKAFQIITQQLGLNPNTTPISCYVEGGKAQSGGAMGPAQFMPNTWLYNYKQRIERITGVVPANPWSHRDAFLAAALYLADWDATTQNRQSEIGAVTAYLCGTTKMTFSCRRAGGPGYVKRVMKYTDLWQQRIDKEIR